MPPPWKYRMGFEQADLVQGVPAHGRGLEPDELYGPSQSRLFYKMLLLL